MTKQQPNHPQYTASRDHEEEDSRIPTELNDSNEELALQTRRTTEDVDGVSQETANRHREKYHDHVYTKHSFSQAKRPVSEDHRKKDYIKPRSNLLSEIPQSTRTAPSHSSQMNEQNQSARHSLNSIGKIWKDFKTLNVMNSASKSEVTTAKGPHHGKGKCDPALSKGLTSEVPSSEIEKETGIHQRAHRTHSQSRSRQGSPSDSQHFRSNSTDRASIMKHKEAVDKGRPFLRSASDDAMLTEQVLQRDSEEEVEDISAEKMKTKILSVWNNVRYGWTVKTRTAFSLTKPIWILGKCFKHRSEEDVDERLPGLDMVKSQAMELFKREFSSRIWLTYRREFPQLAGSSYTTDCGWGCMLRSGQMMLAQALVQHFLGRDWNYYSEQTVQEQRYHHEIVRWFGDQPDDMSPFSLHRLVEIGKSSGKKAGDWYGPASVAHIFKEAMDQAMDLNPLLEQVCVYVAQDCTIYKADVINLCKRKRPGSLQPVFSDHSSPSTPQSPPVSPLRSSTHQLPVGPHLPAVIDTLSSSAVVRDTGSGPPAVEQEKGPKLSPPRRVQQSCQTDFESSSELNGHPVAAVLPPGKRPTNANQAHSSTEPSLARPRKLPTVGSPPSVAPKPKTAHQSRWKGNSPKAQEPSSRSQVEAVKNCIELDDVTHHSNGKPARTSLVAESGKPQKGDDASSTWCASVILVPVRLGGDEVNPIYISSVQALFTLDCCIGIIGGKPKHSLYFVGYQEEKLIHLDPHYCQPVVDMKSREFSLSSFHCMSPRKMAINKMDPSCTIGFYLRTEEDFNQFCEIVPDIVQNSTTRQCSSDYPMFILREGSCHDWNSQHQTDPEKPERYLRVRHFNQNGQLIAPVRETDDFVFLDS